MINVSVESLQDAVADHTKRSRGLQGLLGLAIKPSSNQAIQKMISETEERKAALAAAVDALKRLETTGYPNDFSVEADAEVLADIEEALSAIGYAAGLFKHLMAKTAELKLGEPVSKN